MQVKSALSTALLVFSPVVVSALPTINGTELVERQGIGPPACQPSLVGNGNPHQDKYHQQISDTITCAQSGSCTTGQSKTWSVSVGFSIGTGGGGDVQSPAQWISGGFSVEESYSQTEVETCTGAPGDSICLWHRTDHTAYTVQGDSIFDVCTAPNDGDPWVIRSPNKDDYNTGFYCVVGSCRGKGDAYWEDGEAGGPRNDD